MWAGSAEAAPQVLACQRRAQARDEPAEVIALEVAEQRRRAVQQDPRPADLRKPDAEVALHAAGGGPVGVSGLCGQREQYIEIGRAGHGGAPGNASVEVGTVQATA